jgi:CRP-like cAMP-binding protein
MEKENCSQDCRTCMSGSQSVFRDVFSASEMVSKKLVTFNKGDFIFQEGSPSSFVFCHQSGKVQLAKSNHNDQVLINFSKPGMLLGMSCALLHTNYRVSAISLEDSVTGCMIPAEDLNKLLKNTTNNLFFNVLETLIRDVSLLQERVVAMSRKSARGKVADLISVLVESYGTDINKEININFSITELASMANLSRETFHRVLNQFEKEKIIDLSDKKIKVLNKNLLKLVLKTEN